MKGLNQRANKVLFQKDFEQSYFRNNYNRSTLLTTQLKFIQILYNSENNITKKLTKNQKFVSSLKTKFFKTPKF